MSLMHWMRQKTTKDKPGITIVDCTSLTLEKKLAGLEPPVCIIGYVSPYLDISQIARTISHYFPATPLMLCSTAGELSSGAEQLYCDTGNTWDHLVLECFDDSLIADVQIMAVPLESEDLREDEPRLPMGERLQRLEARIEALEPAFPIQHQDTLAYVLFDGLSSSESFFLEALYNSGKFPCFFVGGSASGKFDFRHTWLHDGERCYENHALIALLKLAPNRHFGLFKSQNFAQTGNSFHIIHASTEQRWVRDILSQDGRLLSFIDALCHHFACRPDELNTHLTDYSFAIKVGKELYVRSIRTIDLASGVVNFYCDIAPGEELHLVKRTSLVDTAEKDFKQFMRGKPSRPIGALLNDCILRRLHNTAELKAMNSVFQRVPCAGFSTFGEILGLNLNETLSAIFFFKGRAGMPFSDHYVDYFPVHYAEFKSFFLSRQIGKLSGLSRLVERQLQEYREQNYECVFRYEGEDENIRRIASGLQELGLSLKQEQN